jgi:hypothetical protein
MQLQKFMGPVAVLFGIVNAFAQPPKTWDAKALADWATPVAGLNVRPGHFSEEEYYRAPIDNLRTYPVYYPGREPEGYGDVAEGRSEAPDRARDAQD